MKLRAYDKEVLQQIRTQIEASRWTMPSLEQLSKSGGINMVKLKVGFRKLFGAPPGAYHRALKLSHAKTLLLTTEMSINEIAWELDYEFPANFCTEFKKFSGYSPLKYREAFGEQEREL